MKKISIVVVLFSLSAIFFSCEKKKEKLIQHNWRLIKLSKDTLVTWYESWEFSDGTLKILKKENPNATIDTIDIGHYDIYMKWDKTYMDIKDLNYTYYNDTWYVLKLNKEILILLLYTNGKWAYREFVLEDK
jgi:hypothetical protein